MARRKRAKTETTVTTPQPGKTVGDLWRGRLGQARKLRKAWETRFQVERCGRFFLGDQLPAGATGTVMNHFEATLKTMKPNLMFRNPKFYVKPKPGQGEAVQREAQIGEAVLEAIGGQDDHLAQVAGLAVQQAFFRIGVLKVCYEPHMEDNPQAGRPLYAQNLDGSPLLTGEGEMVPERDPRNGRIILEPKEVMTDEVYHYSWVDAKRILLPDEGPDMTKWTWIGEEITVPLECAQEDTRFPADRRKAFMANVSRNDDRRQRETLPLSQPSGDDEPLFRYIEFYDIKEKRLIIIADGQNSDEPLLDDDLPDGIEDHPYAILAFTPIIEPEPLSWPKPLTYSWLDVQREYNTSRQQIIEGGKRAARKIGYDDSTFQDVDEAEKALASPYDLEAVKLNDVGRPPVMIGVPPLSGDIYQNVALLRNDWQVITGQTGARLGNPGADSATESMFVERAANLRDVELQGAVQTWLAVAGRKMWQRVRQTMTLDMWVKLRRLDARELQEYVAATYGLDINQAKSYPGLQEALLERYGQEQWLKVSREELTFEADISVVPGSQRPQTLEAEKRSAFEFLGFLGQYPQLAMSRGLMQWIGQKFDPPIPGPVLDELQLLAKQMVDINANQAGRNQGDTGQGAQQAGGPPAAGPPGTMAPLMQMLAGGAG